MNMSLDDVIAKQNVPRGRGRGRPRGVGGRGSSRRSFGGRSMNRGLPPSTRSVPNGVWQHDRFEGGGAVLRSGSINATSKLLIGNLDFSVNDDDVEELFGEFGPLKRASVHYDRSGRSLGSAEVVFERRVDAQRALKQYDNVPLDGRPMRISMVNAGTSALALVQGSGPRAFQDQNIRGRQQSVGRGRGGGGRGRGGRQPKEEVRLEDLDKELDAYVNKTD